MTMMTSEPPESARTTENGNGASNAITPLSVAMPANNLPVQFSREPNGRMA